MNFNDVSAKSGQLTRLDQRLAKPSHFRGWQAQMALTLGWAIVIFFYLFTMPGTVLFGTIFMLGSLVLGFLLAGLRGIDQDLWKAVKIDGIAMWQTYWSFIIPALRPTIFTASFKK